MLQICGIYGRTEDSLSLLKKGLYACELIYIYTLPHYYIIYIVYTTYTRQRIYKHIDLQDLSCFTALGAEALWALDLNTRFACKICHVSRLLGPPWFKVTRLRGPQGFTDGVGKIEKCC